MRYKNGWKFLKNRPNCYSCAGEKLSRGVEEVIQKMLRLHWVTLHRIAERPSNILEGITQHPGFEHSFARSLSRFRSRKDVVTVEPLSRCSSLSTWGNMPVHAESFKQHMLWVIVAAAGPNNWWSIIFVSIEEKIAEFRKSFP